MSLLDLLIRLSGRPRPIWTARTGRAEVERAIAETLAEPRELRWINACYRNPALLELRVRRFLDAFEIPAQTVDAVIAALRAHPWQPPPPMTDEEWAEVADWAWERRRDLPGALP